MTWLEILVEGAADVPVIKLVLTQRFGLVETSTSAFTGTRGAVTCPPIFSGNRIPKQQTLLHQLPAKLKGFSHLGDDACVVVLIDANRDPCRELLGQLKHMLARLPQRPPHTLFRLAIEETESWFIADLKAVRAAYPKARLQKLGRIVADDVVGAWEELAAALGRKASNITGADEYAWAERIAPHMNLEEPHSPSLRKFIEGIDREVSRH